MSIKFIQYLRPNGHKRETFISRPLDVEKKAEEIMLKGLKFETEVLMTGIVSLTVFDPTSEEDIDIELTENGPGVLSAVDTLIQRVHKQHVEGRD